MIVRKTITITQQTLSRVGFSYFRQWVSIQSQKEASREASK